MILQKQKCPVPIMIPVTEEQCVSCPESRDAILDKLAQALSPLLKEAVAEAVDPALQAASPPTPVRRPILSRSPSPS